MANPNPSPATRFQPGNKLGGNRPDPFKAALLRRMTEEDIEAAADVFIAQFRRGDLNYIREFWDRTAGKAVARNEHGDPGDFEAEPGAARERLARRLDELADRRRKKQAAP